MQHFKYSFLVAIVGLVAAFWWGGPTGLFIAAILSVLEVSLSFDNAVVNASVLKGMSAKWQTRFLTWGIVIAVFGMRLLFPIAIVAVVAGMGMLEVTQMALEDPNTYSAHLHASHVEISAFGGMFLLMVFLSFFLDETKKLHWWGIIEGKLAAIGKLESVEIVISLGTLWVFQSLLPPEEKLSGLLSGMGGVILYVLVDSLPKLFVGEEDVGESLARTTAKRTGIVGFFSNLFVREREIGEALVRVTKRTGIAGFLYLEVLDASFSFDGVIGAFAITKDLIIIMLGLAIGAMFVRSLTVYLVRKGTLDEYIYLEHGAHYAIGALALIMLASTQIDISEVVTGLIGAAFIGLALFSSIRQGKTEIG